MKSFSKKTGIASIVGGLLTATTGFGQTLETASPDAVNETWHNTGLSAYMQASGILLGQVVTLNGPDNTLARFNNAGSQIKVQDYDNSVHVDEDIDIFAFAQGSLLPEIDGEAFSVTHTDGTKTVNFSKSYSDPLVFAQIRTFNGEQPVSVQVVSVSADSAELLIGEPANWDGTHVSETIHVVVIESGTYNLSGGRTLHAMKTAHNGDLDMSHLANGREAGVVCRLQPLPACGNSCSTDDANYQPFSYNGLRVTQSVDAALGFTSLESTQMNATTIRPETACLVVQDQGIKVSGTTLMIEGTEEADRVTLAEESCGNNCSTDYFEGYRTITATIRTGSNTFSGTFNHINQVDVKGFGGNDKLDARAINVPATIDGGNGEDDIYGGSAVDLLLGGNDDDVIEVTGWQSQGQPDHVDCGAGTNDHFSVIYQYEILPASARAGCEYYSTDAKAKDMMAWNKNIVPGERLTSQNDRYTLEFIANQLVITEDGQTIHVLENNGNPATSLTSLHLYPDGNLVLHNADNVMAFSTGALGVGAQLVLHDDGELAIYIAGGTKAWSLIP